MSAYPPDDVRLPAGDLKVPLPSPFPLHAGGELVGAELAVETYGTLAADRANAVLLFTGLSASSHAAAHAGNPTPGWWQAMIGPGRALDTDKLFVICVNSLGSCYGSTGPGSIDPTTERAYDASFPELRVEDVARAGQAAVEHFGIQRLHAVVGPSLGGMTVLAHAALFPGRARLLVSISGAMAANAFAIATRALQREILGHALMRGAPEPEVQQAMRWARKIGVLSYVGNALLDDRFGRDRNEPMVRPEGAGRRSGTDFEVESWLEHQANKFVRQFHPWSYWYLSRAMDLFDLAAHGGANAIRAERALVIGVHEDLLFPLDQQRALASALRDAGIPTEFVDLHSHYGHDAFLVEERLFRPLLAGFLDAPQPAPPPHAAPSSQPGAAASNEPA